MILIINICVVIGALFAIGGAIAGVAGAWGLAATFWSSAFILARIEAALLCRRLRRYEY